MPGTRSILSRLIVPVITVFVTAAGAIAQDAWRAIDPADLALKTPVVQKDADAEGIFWDVYLDDVRSGLVLSNYIRIKIFTERGREQLNKIDIQYGGNIEIKDIAARTIKPDGSVVELKKEDVFEREIVKVSGRKLKAKSFVMPGVENGSIIEYRWLQVHPGAYAQYVRLPFQRDIPVQRISYHFKPRPYVVGAMTFRYFSMPVTGLVREADGFFSSTWRNVKAFHEEPMMPPEDQIRAWLLVYYIPEQRIDAEKFWKQFGKIAHEILKPRMKLNDDVRKAALDAVGGVSDPDEKLRRLFDLCRSRVKNIHSAESTMTSDELANRKENKTPSDTLKRGQGNGSEINMLFAAMATAAGFDVRPVLLPDRSDIFFDSTFPDGYFMRFLGVAVKTADKWRFFEPGAPYTPFGMLAWQKEGQEALICDDVPVFVKVPSSSAASSRKTRTAQLRLTDDGTLEGEVRVELTGQIAIEKKSLHDDHSPAHREQTLRDQIKAQLSTAEVSDIRIENVTDPVKPLIYSYRVRVRDYAQKTAKRIFLQPAFFEYGNKPLFTSPHRTHDIFFHYPWSEEDDIKIEIPQGYVVNNPDAPLTHALDATSEYKRSVAIVNNGRTISFQRQFSLGGGGTVVFPAKKYPRLKDYFDAINRQDNGTITLEQAASSSQ